MKIGLSLSRCVLDIAEGRVDIDDVMVIVAGTYFDYDKQDQYKNIKEEYKFTIWGDIPDEKIDDIVYQLWKTGRIHQPRKFGGYAFTSPRHTWINVHVEPHNAAAKEAFEAYVTLMALSGELDYPEDV